MLLAVASVDVEGNSTQLLSLWKKSKSVSIPVRGTDQFSPPDSPVVLLALVFARGPLSERLEQAMLYSVILTFESVDEVL